MHNYVFSYRAPCPKLLLVYDWGADGTALLLDSHLSPQSVLGKSVPWTAWVRPVADIRRSTTVDSNDRSAPRCQGCQERDALIHQRDELIAQLRQRIKYLTRQVQQLSERARRNACNSSTPPSQNPPDAPKTKSTKKPSGRKRGGQPGHPPTDPGLIPKDQLTQPPINCIPETCQHCQAPLSGTDDWPFIHQVIELPPITPDVREYVLHTLTCRCCGRATRGQLPQGVPDSSYGPRLQAFVALCTGCYHLSKRQVEELLTSACNIPICLGSICNIERRVSTALATPITQAKEHLQQAAVVHADETSWPQQPDKAWLWVGVTAGLAVFCIRSRRDRISAEHLLGSDFAGVLVSDRYGAYHWVENRQLCWAHLRRDWQAMIDRGRGSRRIGRRLRELTDHLFELWHQVRHRLLSPSLFRLQTMSLRRQVADTLWQGSACAHPRTAATCADILALEPALWTFVDRAGVEPTNNAAERVLRQAVLWRRKSSGTRSPNGSRYVERILTAVATCRLQGRNVLEYLTSACVSHIRHRRAPSLLPSTRLS